jgi:anti-sigma factor RsiW
VGECTVRPDIAAFVDGELRGARVLQVLRHLDGCSACAAHAEDLRALGNAIRTQAPDDLPPVGLEGLASTIVSRTRAEAAESWRGMFLRAQEDWQWLFVGAGAVAATLVSTLLLSAILAFGPKPGRQDSLSSFIANFGAPAGTLFLWAAPVGQNQEPRLVQVDDGSPAASSATLALARRADRTPSEAALVDALQEAVTSHGRIVALEMMEPEHREYIESLLQEISRLRSISPLPAGAPLNVLEVRLVASTSVTAKGL